MAYLVVNSKYNPYSYDDLIKPFAAYAQAYEAEQERANELATKAAILDSLSPELDSEQYNSYKSWSEELKNASAELASNGLNPQVRQTIAQLNNRFATDYAPLEDKIKTRSALIKEQRDYQQKHPNSFFNVDYSNTPLNDINLNSTYSSYDLDDILTYVGKDVYSRLSSGEQAPSIDEYTDRYASGLTDQNQIDMIRDAVSSGMSLGNANYQQKELENYLSKVRAFRAGSGYAGSTAKQGFSIPAHDGTAINVTYNKKTGEYEINNKQGKVVTVGENDNILEKYYGGDYQYANVLGMNIPFVHSTETIGEGENAKTRDVYSILDSNNKWKNLPNGGKTTTRQLYKLVTGKDFPSLAESEKFAAQSVAVSESNLQKNLDRGNVISSSEDYHQYINDTNTLNKLDELQEFGIPVEFILYRDKQNKVLGYQIKLPEDLDKALNRPIGYQDSFR